jgi:hypothetical protein
MGFDGADLAKRNNQHLGKKQPQKHPADTFIDQPKGRPTKDTIYGLIVAATVTVIVCTLIYSKMKFSGINDNAPKIKTTAQKIESIQERFIRQTKLQYTWATSSTGNILQLDLHIVNSSNHTIKDPSILCSCAGPSGTIISAPQKTLYEAIPPGVNMYFGRVNMGFINPQTTQVRCDIYNLKVQ